MVTEFAKPGWTFFTNHGHVLVCLADDPTIRTRDIAAQVGITERAAQGIISDLVEAGFVTRTKEGRRNHYDVHPDQPLRHPLEAEHTVGELLVTLGKLPRGGAKARKSAARR
jgi:hypothetical protein